MGQISFKARLGEGGNSLFPMPVGSIDERLVQAGIGLHTPVQIQVQGKQGQEQVLFEGYAVKAHPYSMGHGLAIGYSIWPTSELGPRGYREGDEVEVYVTVRGSQP